MTITSDEEMYGKLNMRRKLYLSKYNGKQVICNKSIVTQEHVTAFNHSKNKSSDNANEQHD